MKVELVTSLKRQASKILADLHSSKEPVLITEHGKPTAYLVDVNVNVDDLVFMQSRLAIIEGISFGESAIAENKLISHEQAKGKISKWLK